MTNEEFNRKWDEERWSAMENEADEKNYIKKRLEYANDCFDMYETEGMCDTFESPYDSLKKYNGMTFTIVRRCTMDDGYDCETLPTWRIKLSNGEEIDAYPEDICKIERE